MQSLSQAILFMYFLAACVVLAYSMLFANRVKKTEQLGIRFSQGAKQMLRVNISLAILTTLFTILFLIRELQNFTTSASAIF